MLSMALIAGGGMINILFVVLIALVICYAISRLAPEPVKTVGYIVIAVILLVYIWRSGVIG